MSLTSLTRLEQLQALVCATGRKRPAMIMVGSGGCPPCREMKPAVTLLASRQPGADFYYFNVDHYQEHPQEPELSLFFQRISLQYLPSHVLLPLAGAPVVVCTSNAAKLTHSLIHHHILRSPPFHARRPHHRLLKRDRPRTRRQLQKCRLQRVGHRTQAR